MKVAEAVAGRRSIRKFQQKPIPEEIIQELLKAARYYPSPANLQPLKFHVVTEEAECAKISALVKWAAYLPDFELGSDELPTAYLLMIGDHTISQRFDFCAGAAAELLMLVAYDAGLASCCLGLPDPRVVAEALALDEKRFELLYAIALGYPKQQSTTVDQTIDFRYRLDPNGNFVVPKRMAQEIIL